MPPASIASVVSLRSGFSLRFFCWRSSIARSSPKIFRCPSRIASVSAWSATLKLRAMPQKYQIDVSVSGVMKSTTTDETLCAGSAS